ncbi:hypothetical protein ABT033_00675 [Streptomyces pharetrae]|uniref:hypothetical protein n=1 Tax=Streptomyces pharetrae TaxID=291370 RepID=UPI00334D77B7
MAVAVEQGVQGFADGGATGVQVRGELRVGQQPEDRVDDQVGRRFDAGAVEGDELVQHLGVVEPRGVGDEPGGDVVAGLLARQCDEVADRAGEDLVPGFRVHAVEDPRHAVGAAASAAVRTAREGVEGSEGKRPGMVGEQVGAAGRVERGDGGVGVLVDQGTQPVLVDGVDRGRVRRPVTGVSRPGRARRAGPPLEQLASSIQPSWWACGLVDWSGSLGVGGSRALTGSSGPGHQPRRCRCPRRAAGPSFRSPW